MRNQEKVRCTSARFINFERAYTVYFIRKGSYFEELPVFARSLYQAVAHSVHLITYAFEKLGVIEVVIIPAKASKSGLSVFRQKRGGEGIIKRLQDVTNHDFTVSEVLANWDGYRCITHFLG